jgi:hypothetical protein
MGLDASPPPRSRSSSPSPRAPRAVPGPLRRPRPPPRAVADRSVAVSAIADSCASVPLMAATAEFAHAAVAAHRHRAWIEEQLYGARRRFADTFVRWDHVVADARAFVQPLIDNAGRAATSFTAADAVGYPTSPRLRQRVLDQALTATAAERNGNNPVASRPLTRLREWVEYTATDPTLPELAWLRRLPHRWADEMAKCPPRSLSSSAQTSSSDRSSSTPSLRRNGCSAAASSTATVPPRAAAVSHRVIRTFIRHDPTSDPCPL